MDARSAKAPGLSTVGWGGAEESVELAVTLPQHLSILEVGRPDGLAVLVILPEEGPERTGWEVLLGLVLLPDGTAPFGMIPVPGRRVNLG